MISYSLFASWGFKVKLLKSTLETYKLKVGNETRKRARFIISRERAILEQTDMRSHYFEMQKYRGTKSYCTNRFGVKKCKLLPTVRLLD